MDEYLKILEKLFTPEQQFALVIITIATMSATQAFKNIYFGFHPVKNKALKNAILWLFSICFGGLCGALGYFIATTPQPLWFWLFSGVSSGTAAVIVFDLYKKGFKREVITRGDLIELAKENDDDETRYLKR